MCLLITQTNKTPVLHTDWLEDFYSFNSDGVGVMYVDKGNIVIKKLLPKTDQDLVNFYNQNIKGKNCAWHLRMRTHGNIDLDNCHPYPVLNKKEHGLDMWLMHNGILSTGNKANPSKSDTWHYINDYLKPMLCKNPDFAFHPAFKLIVADHIGKSNKFVLMDGAGRMATINKDSGVYWSGMWLSNTYAWSASTTASKKPITDKKKIAKQALEKPVIHRYALDNNYGLRGNNFSTAWMDDGDISYYEDEIEQLLMDFEDYGFMSAADINPAVITDFINEFSFTCFTDIAYMVLDQSINEDWFIKCMRSHDHARQAFPWLDRVAGNSETYDKHGVNTQNSFNSIKVIA